MTEERLDLSTLTPDVVGALALSHALVVTGATEDIRHHAKRAVDHLQELNDRYPSDSREGHYLDRIEMAALTAAAVITKSHLDMTAAVERAREDYREATIGDMGSQVKYALARGTLRLLFLMGLGYFVTYFLAGRAQGFGADRAWLSIAVAFALPVLLHAARDFFYRMKLTGLAYRRDLRIAAAQRMNARRRIRALECALTLARLAWEQFAPAGARLPKDTPVLTLFQTLYEDEAAFQVPPPFVAVLRERIFRLFRRRPARPAAPRAEPEASLAPPSQQ